MLTELYDGRVTKAAHLPLQRAKGLGVRPRHRKHGFNHGVVVVATAGNRPHSGRIQPSLHEKTVIDVNADDLPEYHVTSRRASVEVVESHNSEKFAFERAGRCGNPRRLHQPARSRLKAGP